MTSILRTRARRWRWRRPAWAAAGLLVLLPLLALALTGLDRASAACAEPPCARPLNP